MSTQYPPLITRLPSRILNRIHKGWEYLYYRFFYSRPSIDVGHGSGRYLVFGGDSLEKAKINYQSLFREKIRDKIKEADLICDHIFNLLGSGDKRLSKEGEGYQPIEWHMDFKNGYIWNSRTFYRNIRYGHIEGVDIKLPWELSRFQHLVTLGQAYILTRDKRYSDEFANQITDWIRSNPVAFGVNWRCTMDVAIRAVNWLVAREFFTEDGLFTDDFLKRFYVAIYEHGRFIEGHLERASGWTTNHYLANIAGLFFIGVYCPFFKESVRWRDFAFQELHKEIEKQVYPDGCGFESSTSYHRLALEVFFYSMLLGDRTGMVFRDDYKERVRKMFEFSLHCIKPNGMIPQVGDNDSGRFLRFSRIPAIDHKYLLNLAAIYFRDGGFKIRQFGLEEECVWIFGGSGKDVYDDLPFREGPVESRAFPDAGWYIIRRDRDYCFISCGRSGGEGWHAHNDKLSFELMLDGQDIIVDPGTYVYTSYPGVRNRFRSTGYHNTIRFNDYEQNEIPDNGLFGLPDRVEIRRSVLERGEDGETFIGEIGYAGIIHKRTITFDKRGQQWRIRDDLICPRPLKARLAYHLSPDVAFKDGGIYSRGSGRRLASIKVAGYEFNLTNYEYSPEYGVKTEAECITIDIPVKGRGTIITHIKKSG